MRPSRFVLLRLSLTQVLLFFVVIADFVSAIRFRTEGGDDLFKMRIAPETIPDRRELELAVTQGARNLSRYLQLIARQLSFSQPGVRDREEFIHVHAIHWVAGDRKQLQ